LRNLFVLSSVISGEVVALASMADGSTRPLPCRLVSISAPLLRVSVPHHNHTIATTIAHVYRSLLASLSDSSRHKMSSTFTGPFTFRMMLRLVSSINSTRTCVTPPREPVRPRTLVTLTSLTGTFPAASILAAIESTVGGIGMECRDRDTQWLN